MRRRSLLTGVAMACLASLTRPANALFGVGDIVFDPTQYAQQLWQAAKQAQQYLTEVQSLGVQLQQYANMVRNSIAIPMQMFSQVQGSVMQLRSIANSASLLAGGSGSIIDRLNSAGYQLGSLSNIGQSFTGWQNTLGNSSRQLGIQLGVQEGDLSNNAALMQALQQHSQSAAGQLQAIQAGNEMAAANGAVLHEMAQTQIALAQTITTNMDVEADRRATEDAAMLHFSTPQTSSSTGWQGF